jgi:hypothetical protein
MICRLGEICISSAKAPRYAILKFETIIATYKITGVIEWLVQCLKVIKKPEAKAFSQS